MLGVVKAADSSGKTAEVIFLLISLLRSRAPVSLGRGDNQFCHKRVYCHEALHLKEKLQSAGSKQETVGWDTDEASDASTTEADLAVYSVPPPSRIHCVEGRSEYAYSRAYSAPK